MNDLRVPIGATGHSSLRATSFAEVMIVIGVLGIMAAIAIPLIGNMLVGAKQATALKNLNFLNGAVLAFNQSNWELTLTPSMGTDDELLIFRTLRYRHPSRPSPGSPYLPFSTSFHETTSNETYRARWNGKMFEIVDIGASGAGINLLQLVDGPYSEMVYDADYQPVGAQP